MQVNTKKAPQNSGGLSTNYGSRPMITCSSTKISEYIRYYKLFFRFLLLKASGVIKPLFISDFMRLIVSSSSIILE